MTGDPADELWPHFKPLWTDLRGIAPGLVLAGGYGLFLKQKWLLSEVSYLITEDGDYLTTEKGERMIVEPGIPTLVAVYQWNDQTPRVTKDLDFVVELNLIASPDAQHRLDRVLAKHDFKVVTENARWQFEKLVDAQHRVVVDFHAPSPVGKRNDVRVQSRRVKPNPSLRQTGIHGRQNAEAIGCELHPFSFAFNGVKIVIPNPVTLAFMKLMAMRDRRLASQNAARSATERELEGSQARKHAHDVCRVMAMITREENELVPRLLKAVRPTPVFADAADTFRNFFLGDEAWVPQIEADMWRAEDFRLIQDTLATWFR